MKKLLSLLGSVGLVATSTITVVACGDTKPPVIAEDISGVINDLKVETNEIFKKHLETNVYKNLIGLEETEKGNNFLNQTKIKQYEGAKIKDINKVLEMTELTKSLNALKNVNKYKIILNDVNSLVKGVNFDWNSLLIQLYEDKENELYLGKVILDYNIQIQYKGTKDIETFHISDTFKYTSTNNQALKDGSDKFYANIARYYFSTTTESDREHTNLRWEGIKGNKELSEGYGLFEGELIYKSSDMSKYSLFNSINTVRSYNDSNSIKADYSKAQGKILVETIFRNDPNNDDTRQALLNYYFKSDNYKIWQSTYNNSKQEFLKELSLNENTFISESKEFLSSAALGYVKLTGLSIKSGDNYTHKLPDFRIAVNYLIKDGQSETAILNDMAQFSVNSLKAWHDTMGIKHGYDYPTANSDKDILMAMQSSKLTNKFIENDEKSSSFGRSNSFNFFMNFGLTDNGYKFGLLDERMTMLNQANLPEKLNYSIGFTYKDKNAGHWMWNYTDFNWITDSNGVNLKWNSQTNNINNSIMLFDLGYINLYIDLAQITMGTKTLGEKYFIKFVK
ncbi:lipoprotein [Spiroplasma endosymbiont of Cantharis lateralis]|uniref:lipoprotein n=1 Tax=Spiroplasma endosymbiont of Cantharis lateralis TaxID=3066277 RepID=UPI00313D3B92